MSLFEVNGRQHAVVHALAFWVAEQLDGFEHVPSGLLACPIYAPSDFFSLQELKEALCDGVVMAIALRLRECSRLCSRGKAAQYRLVNCAPLSEWITRPGPGFRRQIAMNKACTAGSEV